MLNTRAARKRRISFEDPVAGVTTRYCYAGASVIEERDGSDTLVRFHVNGALGASALGASSIDERVATFTEGTGDPADGEFTYCLANQNFSIAGTGNSDGTVIAGLLGEGTAGSDGLPLAGRS